MFRGPLFVLICLFAETCQAQFNDTIQNLVAYSFTGNYNKTNESVGSILNNQLSFSHKAVKEEYNFNVKHLYGTQRKKLTNNDLTALFDINRYFGKRRIYVWGLASYGNILSLKVNNQFQTGAGLACVIFKRDWVELNVSDGILYDYSDVQVDTVRNISQTPRNSLRVRLTMHFRSLFALRSTYLFQNSLEYGNDLIQRSDTEITARIIGHVSARVLIQFNKMTKTKRENLFSTFGLTFSKYF